MAETVSAVTGDGSVKVQSPQVDPTPKSEAEDSASNAPKPKGRKGSTITSKQGKEPELGAQGRVKTQWDNPDADPNLRKHIGEDPDGTENAKAIDE
jgi:hypothetical protein